MNTSPKVIITAAIVGGELTRDKIPCLPLTPQEIAEEAKRCVNAGASIIHLHARDDSGKPTNDKHRFQEIVRSVRSYVGVDVILQVSTGGSVGDGLDSRFEPLESGADMASLNAGSVNFGAEVFTNPRPFIQKLAARIGALDMKPEIEIYDLSHLEYALDLLAEEIIAAPPQFQWVLGVPGGLKASEENLDLLCSRLPPLATWSVAAIGRHQDPMIPLALSRGGNIRVGIEDNIYLSKNVMAQGSFQFVEKAVESIRQIGKSVATPQEAREILGLQII